MAEAKTLEADVVIVGAGLAGALMSYQLAKKGLSVICLEAGPEINRFEVFKKFKEQPDRDFQTPFPNLPHAPRPTGKDTDPYIESVGNHDYYSAYLRGVGGTTWHWAGHAWRFLAEDFTERSTYGVGRDIPLNYFEDIEPYYYFAELMLGVSGVSDPLDYYNVIRKNPYPQPPLPLSYIDAYVDRNIRSIGMRVRSAPSARNTESFDQRPPCCGSNNCMPICPVGAQYSAVVHIEKALHFKNMTLIPNAVVDKIITTDHKAVDYIQYRDPSGEIHKVHGRNYVLTAGGIEIPKLLLYSEIGNENVGRYLLDHPLMFVSFQAKEDVFPGRGPMVLGSIIEHQTGAFRSQRAGFRINLKNFISMQDISNKYIAAGLMGNSLRNKIDEHARRLVGMEIFFGQLPNKNNRVRLSPTRKDIFGIPHPQLDYTVSAWTEKSVQPAYKVCEDIAKACGMVPGSLDFESEHAGPKKRFSPNNHIMGTTVMGNDPTDSAADSHGRIYSRRTNEPMNNLFVASSSLLGATGVSNVSLTIAALALRLADHLTQQMGKQITPGAE